jgi:hypothetical protein
VLGCVALRCVALRCFDKLQDLSCDFGVENELRQDPRSAPMVGGSTWF